MEKNVFDTNSIVSRFCGSGDSTARFFTREALLDEGLWKKFVQAFRDKTDGTNLGWRCEYWGKMMRGAAMIYEYSRDEALYRVMRDTVCDMMTVAESDGRVSGYAREVEFDGWDMWCRKYAMLGMEYFYDICDDRALKEQIVVFLCGCADSILEKVGPEEGKMPVHRTGKSWGGLNSCSVLEPFVRLYRLTGKAEYLKFAQHIIDVGGSTLANIFELAYENKLYPYQYGVSKAYEMISNFEGLIEYYMVTGIEKYKTAAVNFGRALIASDVSVIGSLGATHELLDHTKNRQTVRQDVVSQETCVTVTWMKFCARLLKLTGDPVFADQLEQAYFNAYRGALNTEHRTYEKYLYQKCMVRLGLERYVDTFMPVDSYSPLIPGKRGVQIGGHQMLHDLTYYGCCACISPAGVGSYLGSAVMTDGDGLIVNFFETGTVDCTLADQIVRVTMQTDYPRGGAVRITVEKSSERPLICKIRIPAWSQNAYSINVQNELSGGYALLTLTEKQTELVLRISMQLRTIKPEQWDTDIVYTDRSLTTKEAYLAGPMAVTHKAEDDAYVCLMRGPITLAADSRLGKAADSVFTFATENGTPIYRLSDDTPTLGNTDVLVHCAFKDEGGEEFSLIDYGAAGRDWSSTVAAWLPIEG